MDHGLKVWDLVIVDHQYLGDHGVPRDLKFPVPATVVRVDEGEIHVLDVNGEDWSFSQRFPGFPRKFDPFEQSNRSRSPSKQSDDPVDHPKHYNSLGVEAIEVIEELYGDDYLLGNAMKYLWRAKYKGKFVEDLRKCIWYIERRIKNEQD